MEPDNTKRAESSNPVPSMLTKLGKMRSIIGDIKGIIFGEDESKDTKVASLNVFQDIKDRIDEYIEELEKIREAMSNLK